MRKNACALLLLVFVAGRIPAFGGATAAESAAVMAPTNQFLDGFNTGDTQKILAVGSDQMSVIDEFSPHEWHVPGAIAQWMSDYDVDAKKNGITDGFVKFGTTVHLDVAGDWAYVVIPTDDSFKRNGKSEGEVGSTTTITLNHSVDGWKITGWAWAKH